MCINQICINAQLRKSPKVTVKKSSNEMPNKINNSLINPADYDYYALIPAISNDGGISQDNTFGSTYTYSIGSRVIDTRNGNIVKSSWPAGDTYWLKSRQKLLFTTGNSPILNNTMLTMSTNGQIGRIIEPLIEFDTELIRGGYFSQDFRKYIFQRREDIWIADINVNEGKIVNPKQLTHFGFTENPALWGWYKNYIGLGDTFWVNLETGEVQDIAVLKDGFRGLNPIEVKSKPDRFFSSDRRFALISWWGVGMVGIKVLVIDLKTNKTIDILAGLPDQERPGIENTIVYWLNNRQLIFFYRSNSLKNYLYTFDETGSYKRSTLPNLPNNEYGFTLSHIPAIEKEGRKMFSPDSTKYLSYRNGWNVVDPKSTQIIPIDRGLITWIDDTHLLFYKSNTSVSEQGTYIFDLTTNSRKKLFSYTIEGDGLAEDISYYNSKSNYLIFGTQGILWRCRPDGSELTELLREPDMTYSVRPFIKAIID